MLQPRSYCSYIPRYAIILMILTAIGEAALIVMESRAGRVGKVWIGALGLTLAFQVFDLARWRSKIRRYPIVQIDSEGISVNPNMTGHTGFHFLFVEIASIKIEPKEFLLRSAFFLKRELDTLVITTRDGRTGPQLLLKDVRGDQREELVAQVGEIQKIVASDKAKKGRLRQ